MTATPPDPQPDAQPASVESDRPGRIMAREMAEQPAVLRRILEEGAPRIQDVAQRVAARKPRFVLLTARGTSDNAALYAKYLLEISLGLPCGLASMSTTTAYGARPDLTDVLMITVSQSGGSPDLVASTRAAREAGAITLAVTNNPDSPLAAVSEYHLDIMAGPEKALPATKTYTASSSPSISSSKDCAAATAPRPRCSPTSPSNCSPARTRSAPSPRATASPNAW